MNPLKNLFFLPMCLMMGASCVFTGNAIAGTLISATATDDGTNDILWSGTQLQDGDFLITANAGNPPVTSLGDGWDETIRWNFDFNNDPALNSFLAAINSGADLTKAELTFNIMPTNGLITTDHTGIPGVQGISIPNIPDVVNSVYQNITFTLNLFDYGFDSINILNAFNSGTQNSVPWYWQDDVIMSSASLTLETEDISPVPEPTMILGLLVLGTVCGSTIKRKEEEKSKY